MLARGLALLEAFEPHDVELSQTELARRTDLPKPTVHRLAAELVRWGALERGKTGVRLGQWLYQLGGRAPRVGLLRSVAQPFLDRLHELTGEYVCLSTASRGRAVDVAAAGCSSSLRLCFPARHGTVSPAAARALTRESRDVADEPVAVRVAAREWLGATTVSEVAVIPQPSEQLASVAVRVLVAGTPVAAVSVVSLRPAFDPRTVGVHARAIAVAIGRQLAMISEFSEEFDR
ncbi:helix-turn-helix domain-containing protein [Lentzea sp.]|uniref:helix-turn-helix domain-containing protein n=1 Tax=Lentzea sp. TaxID=56099 RepID=UPI002BDFB976|nr:helix-turn-helix domain-containing protein [Lentzea sp.]HUQ56463.1 helix-turn-helix domain-containing protein [Lentzea sp.]